MFLLCKLFRLLLLREEYSILLPYIYSEENLDTLLQNYCSKLIDKLLIDQADLNDLKQNNSVKHSSLSK